MTYRVMHKASGTDHGVFTEKQKEAYESDVQLKGKYRFTPIEKVVPPKEAKKAAQKKQSTTD